MWYNILIYAFLCGTISEKAASKASRRAEPALSRSGGVTESAKEETVAKAAACSVLRSASVQVPPAAERAFLHLSVLSRSP